LSISVEGNLRLKFGAYLRVSMDEQGKSGLGLEAQAAAIADYARTIEGEILETVSEVASGSDNSRPGLTKALAAARKHKATLIVSRLDRLGRDAAYLLNLVQTSRCPITLADNPNVDPMMFGVLAVFAENERRMISKRTKAALAAAKARGVKLGSPVAAETAAIARARKADLAKTRAMNLVAIIESIEKAGVTTLSGIAKAVNRLHNLIRSVPVSEA
jgi:DNA invertase Pin-like site-specific DNA recombinase